MNRRWLCFCVALCIGGGAIARPVDRQQQFDRSADEVKAIIPVDPKAAIAKADALYRFALWLPPTARAAALAKASWLQGEGYLRVEQPDRAGPLLNRALKALSVDPRPTKLKGDVLLSLGWYYGVKTDVAVALEKYQAAYRIFREVGEPRSEAVALMSLATLYNDGNDFKSALKYIDQASSIYKGDLALVVSIYNTKGNTETGMFQFKNAVLDFQESLKYARHLHSNQLQLQIYRNLIRALARVGQYDKAERAIAESNRLVSQNYSAENAAQLLGAAASVHLSEGRTEQAWVEITRGLSLVSGNEATFDRDIQQAAYDVYSKMNDSQRALDHLRVLKAIDDRTTKLAASTNTALMAARFDFANQELRIERLRRRDLQRGLELARNQALTQRIVFFGAGGAGLVLLVILGFGLVTLRRSRNEVRAANIDLAATNAALAKALAAKTEFLATTSHEIRTPLNGILGMTQVMLADPATTADVRDRVAVVHSAGLSMRALVDDILDVAKMETGHLSVELLPVDVVPLMQDVSRLWEDQARARGLTFTIDLAHAPARVVTDEARLRQAVFNLLSNAVKFTREGGVTLRVAVDGEGAAARLAIDVADTGIGIAPDKLDHVFEAFRQADASTTRLYGGSGLGLTICRNIARALGGDISVTSVSGEGTCFRLLLPLVLAAPVEENIPSDALLIVDRNPISRAMLKTVLAPRAPAIYGVGTLADADMLLARGGVTMVLVEGSALDGDPDRLASFAACARTAGARVAVLWSRPEGDIVSRLVAAGADLVVAKPIAGAALAARLFDRSHLSVSMPIPVLVSAAG